MRLERERGAWANVLTLNELSQWSPRGTRNLTFRANVADAERVAAALRARGMRVRPEPDAPCSEDQVVLTAFAHFGTDTTKDEFTPRARGAIAASGVSVDVVSGGATISGGTPAYRWLEVIGPHGDRLGLKVGAGSEEEASEELDRVAELVGIPRAMLDVERPAGWPPPGLFGLAS